MTAQITIRLSSQKKLEFERYSEKFGLEESALFKLLIVRERHQRRLSKLAPNEVLLLKQRRAKGIGTRMPTVTAHMSSLREVNDFDDYAEACGLNRSSAGKWLLESELREKWLDKVVRTKIV